MKRLPAAMLLLLIAGALVPIAWAQNSRTVTLAPTRPGDYSFWTVGKSRGAGGITALSKRDTKTKVVLSAEVQEVQVLDNTNGTLAVYPMELLKDGAAITLAADDFNRLRLLLVPVTASGGKPVASATVTLTDAQGQKAQRVLTPADDGKARFQNVLLGKVTVEAVSGDNTATETRTITVPTGATPISVPISLTGDVPTLAAGSESSETPAPAPGNSAAAPVPAPVAEPAAEASRGSDWVSGVIGLALLAAALYFGWRWAKNRGMTPEKALRSLGVEMPQDAGANASASAASHLKPADASMALPPLPALSELPEAENDAPDAAPQQIPEEEQAVVAAATAAAVTAAAVTGPRLVGIAGTSAGETVALSEEKPAVIGRDPSCEVALADSTVSRRHARIEPSGGGWAIVDENSSNGTYVNGVRTPGQVLRPGDEVQIGAARFRFES